MTDFPNATPNINNYSLSKGEIYFTPAGGGTERHLGNCPVFTMAPTVNSLDHFSAMTGIKSKDDSVVTDKALTVTIDVEEKTIENVRMFLLGGAVTTNTDGDKQFDILAASEVRGAIRYHGTNDVGPRWNVHLPLVSFKPSANEDLVGDGSKWDVLTLTGEVLAVNGVFGTRILQDSTTDI